jgi:hypothetical protein
MANFLFLHIGRPAQLDATDDETLAFNERWTRWVGALAEDGKLQAGGPLEPVARHVTAETNTAQPLTDLDVHGFLLVEADSYDEAVKLASEAPNVLAGGAVIVRPVAQVPGG